MGVLRYFDGEIAVCDYDNIADDFESTLKLLLEFDTTKPDVQNHVKPLLASERLFHGLWNNSPEDIELMNERDDTLRELGIELTNSGFPHFRISEEAREDCLKEGLHRKLLVVQQEIERVSRLSEALQYLARLYLLAAKGDERSDFVLPQINSTNLYAVEPFEVELPEFFVQYVTSQNLDVPVGFDFERGGCTAVVHVYGKIGRYLDGSCLFGEGEFGIRRIVAAELLEALLNYTSALPFTMEEDAPMIKRDDSKVYTSALADLMIEGKVGACPWCGRPMLLLRKTSKPFCRQSHQTRYNEKARKMLVDGASVNDVIASFEHIQPATIRNWNLAK